MNRRLCAALLWLPLGLWAGDDGHSHPESTQDSHQGELVLSQAQQAQLGLEVAVIAPQPLHTLVKAPGEIQADGHRQQLVAPRIASQIIARQVSLGDWVKPGQPLVTLFSEAMSDRQSALRLAWREWQRAQALAGKALSAQQVDEIGARYEQALAAAQAVGLAGADIRDVQSDQPLRFGEYQLRANQEGRVLDDDFSLGQTLEAGQPLLRLLDERTLWVEAALAASDRLELGEGATAEVVAGDKTAQARVHTQSHRIDPVTRTLKVRLGLDNSDDHFHDGQFVTVIFARPGPRQGLVVPQQALVKSPDGDWQLFVAQGQGRFEAREVILGQPQIGGYQVLDLPAGTPVVVKGAFFLASELAKAGFDAHSH